MLKVFVDRKNAIKYLDYLLKNPLFENGKIDFTAFFSGEKYAFCGNKVDSIKKAKNFILSTKKGELFKIII